MCKASQVDAKATSGQARDKEQRQAGGELAQLDKQRNVRIGFRVQGLGV